jgi:hypothetical protein
MINHFTVSESDVQEIERVLASTPKLMSDPEYYADELYEVQCTLPNLVPNSIDEFGKTFGSYGPEECITVYYTSTNDELNTIIRDLFNVPTEARQFYTSEVTYLEGGHLNQHVDRFSDLTTNILLKDEFEPGHLYIENELVDFSKRGQAVSFPGKITSHRVEPVKSGFRKILSVWYKIPGLDLKPKLL